VSDCLIDLSCRM